MNLPPRKVKAQADVIFFDAAGTLIHLAQPPGWHYAEVTRQHGAPADELALETAFRRVWKSQPPREPSSSPREDDDRGWWKTIALTALRESTKLPASFDEEAWFVDVYQRFAQPGVWLLYDDVLPCLERLKDCRLAVISNFDGRLRRILEDLLVASYFEKLFISSEVGCEKPHPDIFRKALAGMQISPEKALLIGDDARFDCGETVGMRTFLLKRPETSLDDLGP